MPALVAPPPAPTPNPPAVLVPSPCDCPPKDPWIVRVGLALSFQDGNTDKFDVKTDGEVVHDPDPWGMRASLAFVYGETEGERSSENWHGLLRVDRMLSPAFFVFGQGLFDRDVPADLQSRVTGVLGAGVTFLKTDCEDFHAEVGFGAIREKREGLEATTDPTAYAGARYERTWGTGNRIFGDLKVLPNLSDSDLTLTTFEAGYETPVCAWLSLALGVRLDWVVEPPGDVDPLDVLLTAGLKASF
jgi:hypothetical protein